MKNFKLIIEYDGTKYFGWQIQKDDKRLPTIQGALRKALQKIFHKKIPVIASGRTDTGVHAFGQCASFKVDTKIPVSNILKAINTYLPRDIIVKQIKETPLSFNPRFSAKKKWYRYTIAVDPSVFHRYYTVFIPYRLNVKLMRQASKLIKGEHNFSAIALGDDKRKVRRIDKLGIIKRGEFIYVDIIGNGFLYKMARRIIGILVDVGRKKINIEDVRKLMSGKKIISEVQTAPAKGLVLMKVYY